MHRGQFFAFDVYHADGSPLCMAELFEQLQASGVNLSHSQNSPISPNLIEIPYHSSRVRSIHSICLMF